MYGALNIHPQMVFNLHGLRRCSSGAEMQANCSQQRLKWQFGQFRLFGMLTRCCIKLQYKGAQACSVYTISQLFASSRWILTCLENTSKQSCPVLQTKSEKSNSSSCITPANKALSCSSGRWAESKPLRALEASRQTALRVEGQGVVGACWVIMRETPPSHLPRLVPERGRQMFKWSVTSICSSHSVIALES